MSKHPSEPLAVEDFNQVDKELLNKAIEKLKPHEDNGQVFGGVLQNPCLDISAPRELPKRGQKFDQDKVRMELLPVEALKGTAEVLTFGAKKYADRNWEQGISYSRVYGALLRHMTAWWGGENLDPETELSHLHHAGCCIAFLQTFVERDMKDFDDRP